MLQEKTLRLIEKRFGASGAGFFIYHDPGQDKNFGFYIDEDSKVKMLSKPYAAEHYARNTVQRFKVGKFLASIKKGKRGYYAEFKTKGGKVIAWSPEFSEKSEAEHASRRLQGGEPQIRPTPHKVAEPDNTEHIPPRHSFRLDFYQGAEQQPIRGRIEYSLTQESASFQGLDMSLVRSFVAQRLYNNLRQEESVATESGEIRILENGQPANQAILSKASSLEAELEIDLPDVSAYNAFVYAKSLGDKQEFLVGRQEGAGGSVRVPLFIKGLASGLYRFTATLHLKGPGGEASPADYSLSSSLFQLFAEAEAIASEKVGFDF